MIVRPVLVAVLAVVSLLSARVHAADSAAFHHSLTVRLAPTAGRVDVVDVIDVPPAAASSALRLHLAPWLRVSELSVDGRTLTPPAPGEPIETAPGRVVRVAYGGVPPARSDTNTDAARAPLISDDGVYLPAGSGWIPRAGATPVTFWLSVEVPAQMRAVATGRMQSGEGRGGAVFVGDRLGEGPSLFAGPWTVSERRSEGVTYRTWFYPDDAGLADDYLSAAERYTEAFSRSIGPYPFSNLNIVAAPLPVGLGFPGVLYVSRRILPLPFMRGRSLAHEILHSWWGNGVAVDYATGNWSEGLTTYMADYAVETAGGGEQAARTMRRSWLRDFRALPEDRDFPAADFTAREHDAAQVVGYGKVAFLFHMLRNEVGPAPFDAAMRRFWRDHRFRIAGWSDLRAAFEAEAGRDLGPFFEQWVERPGAPRLRFGEAQVERRNGGYRIDFAVAQDEPAYLLTVPVVVSTEAGPERRAVIVEGAETQVQLDVESRPRALALDPDFEVFRHLSDAEAPPILRDVTLDRRATVVLATSANAEPAARVLAARMMDGEPRFDDAPAADVEARPVLLIATDEKLEAALSARGFGETPAEVPDGGTARAWAGRHADGRSFVVVSASNADALAALAGPLPHYGRQGWLVADGRRAIAKGHRDAPPPNNGPMAIRLDSAE